MGSERQIRSTNSVGAATPANSQLVSVFVSSLALQLAASFGECRRFP